MLCVHILQASRCIVESTNRGLSRRNFHSARNLLRSREFRLHSRSQTRMQPGTAQQIAIWALWSRLPAQRELVEAKLLWRTVDCRVYRKEVRRPDGETRAFLDLLFSNTVPLRC